MNNKLLFQDLTDQLSLSGQLKKKDAEEFLKAFFKVIEDALFQDEIVKIQGFGTFKLISVEARKSVNVSTGQEFEIKEHYKITFTPDLGLKELVNEPLSHLEPVELDVPVEEYKPVDNRANKEKNTSFSTNGKIPETMKANKSNSKSTEKEPKRNIKKSSPETKIKPQKSSNNSESSHGKPFWIVFVLILIALGYWAIESNKQANQELKQKELMIKLYNTGKSKKNKVDVPVDRIQDSLTLEAEIAAKMESLSIAEKGVKPTKTVVESVVKEAEKPVSEVAKPVKEVAKPVKEVAKVVKETIKPAVKEPVKQPVKAEVKESSSTSNYQFPVYETMSQGATLRMMALKYYGHKAFWIYLYQANMDVISDPNIVPLGTKIRIPKPDLYKINANDPNCIIRAKKLQSKILAN